MKSNNQKYGFITAISMVIGIVIGSGIFFKADDILNATGGNVALGILGFLVVGSGVLFGSLVISEYAINNPRDGGLIAYTKEAFGQKAAFYVSWFLISVYFPALIVILGFVTAIYLGALFNIESSTFIYVATVLVLGCAFASNILSKRLGGIVQSLATILKLAPLFIIGAAGLFLFESNSEAVSITTKAVSSSGFGAALIAIAFTFDGWIVVTSIGKELKNPRKTLPIALVAGVILTSVIYCLYFIGITNIVTPSEIEVLGDAHVYAAATQIFGQYGAIIIKLFVVIAVYGGLNGMVLAYLRLPHDIINQGLMKDVLNIDKKLGNTGFASGVIVFELIVIALILTIHILANEAIIFGNLSAPFDISTLPITFVYIIYIALYVRVFKVTKKTKTKRLLLSVYVVLATLISLVVIVGATQINGALYIVICLIIAAAGTPLLNNDN